MTSKKPHTFAATAIATAALALASSALRGQDDGGRAKSRFVAAFRFLAGPSEVMPQSEVERFSSVLGDARAARLDWRTGQYVRTGDNAAWVVYGREEMCLIHVASAAFSCSDKAEAIRNGQLLGLFVPQRRSAERPKRFEVLGIVPDTVKSIQAEVNRRQRGVPVIRNAFSIRANAPITIRRLERKDVE